MASLSDTPPVPGPGQFAWWRNKFIAGLFVAVPLVVTYVILKFIYRTVSSYCDPLVIAFVRFYREALPDFILITDIRGATTIPGAAFLITILVIVALGLVATNVLGSRVIAFLEWGLLRIPLVNLIYPVLKQVVDSIKDLGGSKENLENRQVVYLRYPNTVGGYLLGFLTGRFTDTQGRKMVTVFIPTAPNPITGFVLVFDARDIVECDLPMDVAWKMIVSAGFVVPRNLADLKTARSSPAAPIPRPDDTTRTE